MTEVLAVVFLVALFGLTVLLFVDALLPDAFDEELRRLLEEERR
jgi:hypothetical protein